MALLSMHQDMEEDDPPSLLLRKHSSHLGFHDGQGTFSFAAVFGHDEGDVSDGWLDHAAAVVAEGGDLRAAAIAAEFRNRVGRAPRDGEHHWDALLGYSSSSSSSSADENVKVVDEAYAIFDAEAADAEATDDWTEEEAATVTVAASPRHAARSPHHFGSSQGSRHHWGGVSPPKPDAMHDSHSTLPPALRPATHDADNEAEVEPFDSDDKDDDAALVATLAAMLEGEESPAGSDADVEHVEDNCAEIDAQLEREQAEIDRLMAQIGGTDAASSAAGAAAAQRKSASPSTPCCPRGSSPQTSVTCLSAPGQSADRPGPWMTTTAPAAGRSVGARRGVGRSVPGAWMGVGRSVGPVAAQRRGLLLQMPSRCRCSVAADRQRVSLEPKQRMTLTHKQADCLARSMQ